MARHWFASSRMQTTSGTRRSKSRSVRLGNICEQVEAWRPAVMPHAVRIYTDKPLYQPGQTVHMRMLALGPDGKARSGVEYGVEVNDEKATTLHSSELTTSAYGIAHTDWEVPANAASGKYEIASCGGSEV